MYLERFLKILKNLINRINQKRIKINLLNDRKVFINNGNIPWSKGYNEYKQEIISNNISDKIVLNSFSNKILPKDFGFRLDERVVEYPWIFEKLPFNENRVLDAGSTFNFEYIVNHPKIKDKDLTIFTYAPENEAHTNKRISYVYGDLRDLPFKDNLYDIVVSQSTIEHIDMDNSIYGYEISHNSDFEKKSYEYIVAVKEMIRVLKSKGNLLLTFPYGQFENHGFFQQFDYEMLDALLKCFDGIGNFNVDFFKYEKEGWRFAEEKELKKIQSYNPHTGKGKGDDSAAHCRSVACISFIKN